MGAYSPPTGSTDPNAPYEGKNTAAGNQGSRIPRTAIEMPQREIHNAIQAFGLTPTNDDFTQLTQAIRRAVSSGARVFYGVDDGSLGPSTLVIPSTDPDIRALVDGTVVILKPAATNTAGVSVKLAGLGTFSVLTRAGAALQAGDMAQNTPVATIVYQGTLRIHGLARSEIGAAAAASPAVLALTPAGALSAVAFTAGMPFGNFTGGSVGGTGLPNPYTVVQTLTIRGATYIDATGVVGFRSTDTTGSDCRVRLVATGGGLPAIRVGQYLGIRTVNYNQIPPGVGLNLQNVDKTQDVQLQLIVDRSETAGTVQVYDPLIRAAHNGIA